MLFHTNTWLVTVTGKTESGSWAHLWRYKLRCRDKEPWFAKMRNYFLCKGKIRRGWQEKSIYTGWARKASGGSQYLSSDLMDKKKTDTRIWWEERPSRRTGPHMHRLWDRHSPSGLQGMWQECCSIGKGCQILWYLSSFFKTNYLSQ